jgi:hypothetical protein
MMYMSQIEGRVTAAKEFKEAVKPILSDLHAFEA